MVLISKISLIWLIPYSALKSCQMGEGITVLIYGVCNGKKRTAFGKRQGPSFEVQTVQMETELRVLFVMVVL